MRHHSSDGPARNTPASRERRVRTAHASTAVAEPNPSPAVLPGRTSLLALQRTSGNAAVTRLVRRRIARRSATSESESPVQRQATAGKAPATIAVPEPTQTTSPAPPRPASPGQNTLQFEGVLLSDSPEFVRQQLETYATVHGIDETRTLVGKYN